MALLRGKRALVVGLMNKHSIAASVTQALLAHGARVLVASKLPLSASQRAACGFHAPGTTTTNNNNNRNGGSANSLDAALQFAECDVEDERSVQALAERCGDAFDGKLDVLVHSVAFAPKEAFPGTPLGFLNTSKAAWTQAMDVSAYSLVALTRATYPLLQAGGEADTEAGEGAGAVKDRSVLALTYAGSTKVMPSYNVMGPAKAALEAAARQLAYELGPDGIRVNCVSPGPINTVSARGIPGISRMRQYAAEHAPLRRTPMSGDVGAVAAFLASDLASSVTGQTIYVDGGLSAMAPYVRDGSDAQV